MEFLQTKAFLGKEKKGLPFIIANMHLIFNGIKFPNIVRANTLSKNIMEIQEKDKVDIIVANPPFGGKENESVQMNFPIKTGASENMFMQYFIKNLKQGGRAAIIIKSPFLSNDDSATSAIRQELVETTNLHTILDLPNGTFTGSNLKTVVLFFDKNGKTDNIWYYQLKTVDNLGKKNPIHLRHFKEFLDNISHRKETNNSWLISSKDLNKINFDLSIKNPNEAKEISKSPIEIIKEIEKNTYEQNLAISSIKKLI